MRVLIVDHDSTVLEATVRALREHFVIDAVTNKADCIDLLRQNEFDVVIACERLADGSGLELLSQIAKRWPGTLRVFAAERERLRLLQGRLGPFELFQALSYPLNPDKLLSTLSLAREAHDANADTANIEHIVLSGDDPTEPEPAAAPAAPNLPVTERTPPRTTNPSLASNGRAPTPPHRGRQNRVAPARFSPGQNGLRDEPPPPINITPRIQSRRATRFSTARPPLLGDGSASNGDSLAEAADIAAAARARLRPVEKRPTANRRALIAGTGLAAVLLVTGLVVPKWGAKPHVQASPAVAVRAQPQLSNAVADRVAEVETDFVQENFNKARADIRLLQQLAPDHPRLPFFLGLLDRKLRTRTPLGAREQPRLVGSAKAQAVHSGVRPDSPGATMPGEAPTVAAALGQRSAAPPEVVPGRARPDNESGPILVAGAPTSTVPLLVPASALPETSSAMLEARPAVASAVSGTATSSTRPVATFGTAPASAIPVANSDTASRSVASGSAAISDAPPAAPPKASATVPVVTAEAQLTHRVAPQYPDLARRKGIQGYVDLRFTITPRGTVTDIAVVASDPADIFNRAATEAVRRWRYDPRVVDGRPVESQSQVRVQFELGPH
jgi:periplasmic protein TonB